MQRHRAKWALAVVATAGLTAACTAPDSPEARPADPTVTTPTGAVGAAPGPGVTAAPPESGGAVTSGEATGGTQTAEVADDLDDLDGLLADLDESLAGIDAGINASEEDTQ